MPRGFLRASAAVFALLASPAAFAQRTDDNATEQAEDAFGTSVGDDSIGIYNPFLVRGFSPVDAGNVRIEGLYFDQQVNLTGRVLQGSTIRVGISAQSYAFPAPTGIADFSLRKPGAEAIASFGAAFGPWGGYQAEVDAKLPLDGDRLGIAAGMGIYRSEDPSGATPEDFSIGAVGRFAPDADTELLAFWSRIRNEDSEAQPLIFTSGDFLPKRFPRNEFYGQDWADSSGEYINFGSVVRAKPLGLDVSAGVFRSVSNQYTSAADLLFDTAADGSVGRRVLVLEDDDRSASTSGEIRVGKSIAEGPRRHTLIASVRGRAQDRRYGGAAIIDLGASTSLGRDPRPKPNYAQGPKTFDRVRQATYGVAYQGRWRKLGELTVGVQKTHYTKRVTDPDPAVMLPATKDSPVLWSANAAIDVSPRLALYGGYATGLEESPVAPREAVNLNEAPPAIRTRQKDAGVRWRATDRLTAVVGVFDVEKPYFNLDAAKVFRQRGMVRHRGVEISVAGQLAPGLNLVAGNVFLDATISGDEVEAGLIGERPVSTFRRYTVASLDYRLPSHPALSFDLYTEGTSDRVANSANTLFIPTRAILNVGSRYRFKIGKANVLARAQIGNITNSFGWSNGSSGLYVPNGSRRFTLALAADV